MRRFTAQPRYLALGAVIAALGLLFVAAGPASAGDASDSWTQWGGPNGDFTVKTKGLAKSWPDSGPPQLWSRELGEGYSAVLAESGRLYTMYRDGEQEVVTCLNAKDGKAVWEHRYDDSPREGHVHQFGDGPRATPLIAGDMLYTVGVAGKMNALKKSSGEIVWSKELWDDMEGSVLPHGYSSSPIEYKGTVIVLVGGEGHSIVAFNQKDGSTAWKAESFENSYSTPRIFNIGGKDQLITFMATQMVGMDPGSGKLLWTYAQENQWKQNIAMPALATDGNTLFLSSPHAGARGLKLTSNGDGMEVEEIWSTRKIQFYHVSTVRQGDWVYGTTGTMTPAFLAAINIKTGEIGWRERGFAKANLVSADGRLIILDEDGSLALATASPEKLDVHSRVQLLEKVAWTVPTLVGKTLFVRDKNTLMALDLS